jgi:hypothetical protein
MRLALLLAAALPLGAQTLVEHSLATGAASGAASGMSGIGKAAASVFEKANQTLGAKGNTTSAPASSSNSVQAAPKSEIAPTEVKLSPPPDPAAVKIGMTGREAIEKFGPPAMKLTSSDGAQTVESWTWGSGAEAVALTLRDGKVTAVNGPLPKPPAARTDVVVLQ